VEARLAETRAGLASAAKRETAALEALDRSDLEAGPATGAREATVRSGPRHYLTSRGLSVLVGRGARENHHLTFGVARGEDLWLHARDVPGGHVILRDPENRAGPDDIREAAELAAFFSDARTEGAVDVHVSRRKNLRSAGGGRVRVGHSETVRAQPRDPEGRLRKR
jgi:predicted ribosome quality control (RQC) complex YloA/Tae2 family protein